MDLGFLIEKPQMLDALNEELEQLVDIIHAVGSEETSGDLICHRPEEPSPDDTVHGVTLLALPESADCPE